MNWRVAALTGFEDGLENYAKVYVKWYLRPWDGDKHFCFCASVSYRGTMYIVGPAGVAY